MLKSDPLHLSRMYLLSLRLYCSVNPESPNPTHCTFSLFPQVVLQRGHRFGADWWALGVLVYEVSFIFISIINIFSSSSSSMSIKSPCECEHNHPDSLDARLFPSVVFAVVPAVTMDEVSSLSWSQQARQRTPRRGIVAHLGNRGCFVFTFTRESIGSDPVLSYIRPSLAQRRFLSAFASNGNG